MHAHFWESEEIKADWLNLHTAEGDVAPLSFDGWFELFQNTEDRKGLSDMYKACL